MLRNKDAAKLSESEKMKTDQNDDVQGPLTSGEVERISLGSRDMIGAAEPVENKKKTHSKTFSFPFLWAIDKHTKIHSMPHSPTIITTGR